VRGLSDAGALLAKATKELRTSWDMTASIWRDQARAGFEAAYLDDFVRQAKAAAGAMDHISAILREAMAKCR
jgi:hypothetical protein